MDSIFFNTENQYIIIVRIKIKIDSMNMIILISQWFERIPHEYLRKIRNLNKKNKINQKLLGVTNKW